MQANIGASEEIFSMHVDDGPVRKRGRPKRTWMEVVGPGVDGSTKLRS